ncbi:MAG TPA: hypothetical protein DCX29_06525, partial [Hyphomonas sp.]|nr:hypothetical protein [Hyphomonas sp.]
MTAFRLRRSSPNCARRWQSSLRKGESWRRRSRRRWRGCVKVGEWRKCELGDVIELKRGYDLPSRLRTGGEFPLISSSGRSDTHDQSKVSGPGVVTGRYGTIGQVFYIEEDFWPLNTTLYVRDFKGNNPRFIYYFLQGLNW